MHGLRFASERSKNHWVSRRRLLLITALVVLCLGSPAPASAIVHGTLAEQGEYPAQGYLGVDSDLNGDPNFACGGTLVGSRQFLTAAHCLISAGGLALPVASFTVRLGDVDLADPTQDNYNVVDVDRHPGFLRASRRNDIAMLTLNRATGYEPMRVVDNNEDSVSGEGSLARVVGWGQISASGPPSDLLQKGDVRIGNAPCAAAYGVQFEPTIMVCATPAPTTVPGNQDICIGDGGGPLLAPSGGFFVLAGVAARDTGCGDADQPATYARLGDDFPGSDLNSWVHDRTPEADFDFDHAPRANDPVTLTSTSRYPPRGPAGDDYFDTFKWDLDNDGAFDDALGKSVSHRYPTPGEAVTGVEASNAAEGDRAVVYYAFGVGPDPSVSTAETGTGAQSLTTPPTAIARPPVRLATIFSAKRPKVGRRGRVTIRVRFARTAPRGIAVIEVFRAGRAIGIARTRVLRGGEKRVKVKLTPTGRRLLAAARTKRLKVRVRVRVQRTVLRSKTLTIRR
jgi:hypothetical protein